MTSAYDLPSEQTLGEGEGGQTSARRGGEYVIAEVKFCISSNLLVSAVIYHMSGRTFKEWKNKKKRSFFPLNFSVYINLDKEKTEWTQTQTFPP